MKNMLVYWSVYGLVELILYVWLFHWIGFWPLFLIQVLSTAFGLFMFRRVGGTLFRNILDGRTVTPYLLDTICFLFLLRCSSRFQEFLQLYLACCYLFRLSENMSNRGFLNGF
ncbi:exclusion suppressor FxsA [Listeria floridensis FSL S10-1187]|uniref:Exclusion suppressor FxsA n=1 Tax=Listeria floridensis FSL S10-1187 TaxID=1265817 RepID=A0ABN0RHF9_9LIST|nr:exclusion suppressor FxsA [Listeria floridensis FSL S10-1187]